MRFVACALMTLGLGALLAPGCSGPASQEVVVYTALDDMYSRPILESFEQQTGIKVRPVYDTEASKTTGLVTRVLSERERPRADVFWNNEAAQTILLKNEGALEPYHSTAADAIPAQYKDGEHYWTGFAARGRVIIINTDLVTEKTLSILDYTDPKWRGKAAIAKPLFGTTATHAAALFAHWGEDKAKQFFHDLKKNDVAILAGNATVRDMVARGEFAWGLTDTDDANGAVEDGFPVEWYFPDQGEDQMGTLIIPNTVALVRGGPNPEAAKKIIDYLLSPEVERKLSEMRSLQIPLNPAVDAPESVPNPAEVKTMPVSFAEAAAVMPQSSKFIREEFVE